MNAESRERSTIFIIHIIRLKLGIIPEILIIRWILSLKIFS